MRQSPSGSYDKGRLTTYRNAVLIYNPHAGGLRGGRVGLVKRVVEALCAAGHEVEPVATRAPGDATRIAREAVAASADLILSVGGDGTLNETLNGMVHSDVPLAVVPAGTANVLAREIGVGCDSIRVARVIGDLMPRRVALGLLHSEPNQHARYFLLMAGVGFDAHIVYNLSVPLKARLGQIAYWVGAFKEFGREQDEFQVEIGGRELTCSFALASRVRNYAAWMKIAREITLLEDEFEFVLCEGRSTFRDYVRYLAAVLADTAASTKGMWFLKERTAAFSAPPDSHVYVQIDGEYAGRLPARVAVAPRALTLLAPTGYCGLD